MAPVERVALLALIYRAAWRERGDFEELVEVNPGGITLLSMYASQLLTDPDWEIIDLIDMDADPIELVRELAQEHPLRAEAVLHAWPQDPQRELAGEPWARPYVKRWALVEAMMTALNPVSWTRETQEDIARAVG